MLLVKISVSITSIKTISRDEYATYEMEVVVKDLEHLNKLILDLNNLPYITSVERLIMMRVLVQRCSNAKCVVNNKNISEIDNGLMLLVGFTDSDNKDTILKMVNKILILEYFLIIMVL